jgi:hypothetical protein
VRKCLPERPDQEATPGFVIPDVIGCPEFLDSLFRGNDKYTDNLNPRRD